jgi:hypothetical protein
MNEQAAAPATTITPEPTPELIAAAIKEFNDATDRAAVIQKYPFLENTLPEYRKK